MLMESISLRSSSGNHGPRRSVVEEADGAMALTRTSWPMLFCFTMVCNESEDGLGDRPCCSADECEPWCSEETDWPWLDVRDGRVGVDLCVDFPSVVAEVDADEDEDVVVVLIVVLIVGCAAAAAAAAIAAVLISQR